VETDFIFAAIGEELGLLGAVGVLVAYLLIVGTGLRIAMAAQAPFNKLLATGLTAILGVRGPAQRFGPKAMRSAAEELRSHCLALSGPSSQPTQ